MAKSGPIGQYTSANITDKVAIELLRHQKGWSIFFQDLPKNWRAIVAGTPVEEPSSKSADRSEAIAAEKEIEDNPSIEFLAKEAIKLIEKLDKAKVIQDFTEAEHDAVKIRVSVTKAAEKRIKELKSA